MKLFSPLLVWQTGERRGRGGVGILCATQSDSVSCIPTNVTFERRGAKRSMYMGLVSFVMPLFLFFFLEQNKRVFSL